VRARLALAVLAALLLTVPSPIRAENAKPENRPEVFAQMQDRLQRSPLLRADFRQERQLRILRRPLVSTGRMVLSQGQGVLWQVVDPHPVTYLIRPAEVLEWEGDAGPRRVAMAAVPGFRLLTQVFLAALAGDVTGLEAAFTPEPLPAESGWRVSLTPTSAELSEIIASLEVAGDRYVEEVHLQEAGGDAVHFTFTDFQTEPASLDAAETSYFAH
jgi:hypothetical protein